MDECKPVGIVDIVIDHEDGRSELLTVNNRILLSGRQILAKALANDFGAAYLYYVTGIAFGSGGTVGGVPRYVDDTRTGLFGPTVITKAVISSINPDSPNQATFTSVLTFDEANGSTINEIALRLASTDYFSMATFGDVAKSSSMQITFNWRLNFV